MHRSEILQSCVGGVSKPEEDRCRQEAGKKSGDGEADCEQGIEPVVSLKGDVTEGIEESTEVEFQRPQALTAAFMKNAAWRRTLMWRQCWTM